MSFKKFRDFFSISNFYKVIRDVYKVVINFIFRRTNLSEVDAALFSAIKKGHTEPVALLLARGANANAVGSFGFRPLLTALAAKSNSEIMVNLLLKHGADVNTVAWFGVTPMQSAIMKCKLEIVALFLRHGADINAVGWFGMTPLHFAVTEHQCNKSKEITFSIVKLLVVAVLLDNINATKPDFIHKTQSISTSWDETKVILNKKLAGTLLLWDLCNEKNENKLAFISQNEEIKKALEDLNFKKQCPYLREKVQSQIQKGIARNRAIDTASKLIFTSNANKELNKNCSKETAKNLPREDLKNTMGAASSFFKQLPSNDSANFSFADVPENRDVLHL